MIAKCPCQECGVNIEFEAENAGQFVPCPACEKQTRLLLPGSPAHAQLAHAAARAARIAKRTPIEDQLESIGRFFFWGGIFSALVAAAGVLISVADGNGFAFYGILVIFCLAGQGIIIRACFDAGAEAIRLLRKIAAKSE